MCRVQLSTPFRSTGARTTEGGMEDLKKLYLHPEFQVKKTPHEKDYQRRH